MSALEKRAQRFDETSCQQIIEALEIARKTGNPEDLYNFPEEIKAQVWKLIGKEAGKSRDGKLRADKRHNAPGESREKHQKIRDEWATGAHISKNKCAEKMAKNLGVSFSKARSVLNNIPYPQLGNKVLSVFEGRKKYFMERDEILRQQITEATDSSHRLSGVAEALQNDDMERASMLLRAELMRASEDRSSPLHIEGLLLRQSLCFEVVQAAISPAIEIAKKTENPNALSGFSEDIKAYAWMEVGEKESRSQKGRNNANKKHDASGGSREKRRKMREEWATGKYKGRNECAEAMYEGLGITFETAREALENAPEPQRSGGG